MITEDQPQASATRTFHVAHVLWYAVALIVVAAIGLFSTVSAAVMGGFTVTSMEVGALVAAAIALRFLPFPFLTLILAVALWFVAMDVAIGVGGEAIGDWELRRRATLAFGLAAIATAWALDLSRARRDYGFWLHLIGATTLWCALAASESAVGFGREAFWFVSLGFIVVGLFLKRSVYSALGVVGGAAALACLAAGAFEGRLPLAVALTALVLAIIVLGVAFQRRQRQIYAAIARHTPAALRALRPARAFAN